MPLSNANNNTVIIFSLVVLLLLPRQLESEAILLDTEHDIVENNDVFFPNFYITLIVKPYINIFDRYTAKQLIIGRNDSSIVI